MTTSDVLGSGFMIVRKSNGPYYGVERPSSEEAPSGVFEPILVEGELEFPVETAKAVWKYYPAGWRRNAYKLFEEASVRVCDSLSLIKTEHACDEILEHVPNAEWEVVHVTVHELGASDARCLTPYGFDVAYPGGDYFSAIRNGVLSAAANRSEQFDDLLRRYGPRLNEWGLLSTVSDAVEYLDGYRMLTRTERDSTFVIYELRPNERLEERRKAPGGVLGVPPTS